MTEEKRKRKYKILRTFKNGVDMQTALELSKGKMLTNKEMDELLQNDEDYEKIKDALPCWTATHIQYKAGATEAEVWDEGETEKTKINLPRKDGDWYYPDKRYGIPNGEKSHEDNHNVMYLSCWQDSCHNGLVVRGCDRLCVDADCEAFDELGVVVWDDEEETDEESKTYITFSEKQNGKIAEVSRQVLIDHAIAKEAFVLSEMDAYIEEDKDGNLHWSQKVKLRLKTIEEARAEGIRQGQMESEKEIKRKYNKIADLEHKNKMLQGDRKLFSAEMKRLKKENKLLDVRIRELEVGACENGDI